MHQPFTTTLTTLSHPLTATFPLIWPLFFECGIFTNA